MEVKEVLRVKGSTLFTVSPESLLSDAVITMSEHDIGSLVVMEAGKLLAAGVTMRPVEAALEDSLKNWQAAK